MNSQVLFLLFLLTAIVLALDLMRRSFFSIISKRKEQIVRVSVRKLRKPVQPWVSVLVYGKNQATAIEATIRLVKRSRYIHFDIVIVSDRSRDATAARMKQFIANDNGKVPLAFLQRRVVGTKFDAYRAAYRKSRHGAIVLCLNAGESITPEFMKCMVVTQKSRKYWWNLTSAPVKTEPEIQNLVLQLRASVFASKIRILACTPAFLKRRRFFLSFKVRRYVMALAWVAAGMLPLAGCLYGGLIALWYAWVLCVPYLLGAIWLNTESSTREKWGQSFAVPSALFLIPVGSLIQGAFQLNKRK